MSKAGLDNRHRNHDGEISHKHGNTLIGTLRKIYGQGFAAGYPATEKLSDILLQLNETSLSQLRRDHETATWSTRSPTLRNRVANAQDARFHGRLAVAGIERNPKATRLFDCSERRDKSRHRRPYREQLVIVRGIRWFCRCKYGGTCRARYPASAAPGLRSHDGLIAGDTGGDPWRIWNRADPSQRRGR
jgi:hypothetical protein